jgi:hypothetical protein
MTSGSIQFFGMRGRLFVFGQILWRNTMSKVTRVLFLFIAIACLATSAMAQSTIFNIPTTDAVGKGGVYAEFDYLAQTPTSGTRTHIMAPRIVVGVGGNVEAGANVFAYRTAGVTQSYFVPNIKWKFYSNDSGVAASAGTLLYTPINNSSAIDTYGLVFANLSKKVDHAYGPRLTFGPYGIVGADDAYVGTKGGAIVGLEQPIHAKASIVADWFSGVSGFGYFTPGVSIVLPGSGLLNVGYSIGNDSYKAPSNNNRYFFIYYGVSF